MKRWFSKTYDRALSWSAHPQAPRYLSAVSFADASFFPISPVIMIVPMTLAKPEKAFYWAFLATLFSILGGLLGYILGYYAFQPWVLPMLGKWGYLEQYQAALLGFQRFGYWILFLAAFVPIPYKFFTIAAGVLQLNIPLFILASSLGRGLRFSFIAGVIRFGGHRLRAWFEAKMQPPP